MIQFDFIIRQQDPYRPAVAIDVLDGNDIEPGDDEDFRSKLWYSQTRHGILFSRGSVWVYEDLLPHPGPDAYKVRKTSAHPILETLSKQNDTSDLPFALFKSRVRQWVDLLVNHWDRAVPPSSTEALIGLVPAAAEGELETDAVVEDLVH